MKVIGLGEGKYICEVTDDELWHIHYDGADDDEP